MEDRTANTVKLVSEVFVPGASQFIEGRVASGATHLLLGGLAMAVLAPAAPVLAGIIGLGIRLDSFSSAVTGKGLWQQFERRFEDVEEPHRGGPKRTAASTS
jgi:hypothetical protein